MLLRKIINIVADFYAVSPESIKGLSRKKDVLKARHIVCYLARKKNHLSYPKIGSFLNGRDHSTIMNAYKKISIKVFKSDNLRNEINYFESCLENPKEDKSLSIYRGQDKKEIKEREAIKKIKVYENKYSKEQLERIEKILEKYRLGFTLNDIGKEFKITRERVRQIVISGLKYEIYNNSKKYTETEVKKFIKKEKENHLSEKKKRYSRKEIVRKEKKWSINYDHCKKCCTTKIKHMSNGYCVWCYPKTEIFKNHQKESFLRNKKRRAIRQREYSKEYIKRPETKARLREKNDLLNFSGNREKAIERDDCKCVICGLSRDESFERFERDLYVKRIDGINNNLENLKTVCFYCFKKKRKKQNE